MSKEKAVSTGVISGMFQLGLYKRNQGRITRQVTFAFLALGFALISWKLFLLLESYSLQFALEYWIAGAVLTVGLVGSFWGVNYPRFADFLIAVEAEVNKVSWPSKQELIRSSMVVIFVIFFLAAVLFGFDMVWRFVFQTLGVLRKG